MFFVTELPNKVLCLSKKSDELPDGSTTYGTASEFYDKDGFILKEYKSLPKFSKNLVELSSLANDA